jgi:hypothetical protein
MTEALAVLVRARDTYAALLIVDERRLEKAVPDTPASDAIIQRIETLRGRIREINEALARLGGAPEPLETTP